jgi:hypothetical protein
MLERMNNAIFCLWEYLAIFISIDIHGATRGANTTSKSHILWYRQVVHAGRVQHCTCSVLDSCCRLLLSVQENSSQELMEPASGRRAGGG